MSKAVDTDVAVIGAGAWGTALAIHATRAGHKVTLWARDAATATAMQASRHNPRLPDATLPPAIHVTPTMPTAALLLLAVPLQQVRAVLPLLPPAGALVICAKGVEIGRLAFPLDIARDVLPGRPACVLTGPNFAHEIAAGLPAAAVVAGSDAAQRAQVITALATPGLRLYGNDDPIGAQVGGAAKNVVAIAAGVVIGAGLGENARAALVTRGLAEIARLATALGGRADTVAGLSGLGDLLLTCTGPSSRNFRLGLALGRGQSMADIMAAERAVVEGVPTSATLLARAASVDVDLPICRVVAALVAEDIAIAEAMHILQSRPRRDE
jgi:glycerol-3-phosphate dehydrogenase (NAD(P)+)